MTLIKFHYLITYTFILNNVEMSEAIEINNPIVSKIMPRVVDIKNAKIMHQNHLVLDNVNFEVRKGDFVYLIGRTGSGKSSLLKHFMAI